MIHVSLIIMCSEGKFVPMLNQLSKVMNMYGGVEVERHQP
jgi:hypothetical protein